MLPCPAYKSRVMLIYVVGLCTVQSGKYLDDKNLSENCQTGLGSKLSPVCKSEV